MTWWDSRVLLKLGISKLMRLVTYVPWSNLYKCQVTFQLLLSHSLLLLLPASLVESYLLGAILKAGSLSHNQDMG